MIKRIRRYLGHATLGLALLLLGACNAIPGYSEYNAAAHALALEGIGEYQKFHDDARQTWLMVGCDTSIGSISREPNALVKEFLLRNPLCPTVNVMGLGGSTGAATFMGH